MKIKRKSILAVVLLMAILLLTGCEGKRKMQARERNADSNREYIDTESEAEEITMPITFVNHTGDVIYSLQASPTDTDNWEEDLLEDDILEDGGVVHVDFYYLSDKTVWDFAITDADDEMREYYDLDFKDYGEDGITIVFNADESAGVYEGADAYESLTYESNTQANTTSSGPVTYCTYTNFISQFSCTGGILTVRAEEPFRVESEDTNLTVLSYPVAEDCIWGFCFVESEDVEYMSYDEVKSTIAQDKEESKLMEIAGLGVWIVVENGRVTRVLLVSS